MDKFQELIKKIKESYPNAYNNISDLRDEKTGKKIFTDESLIKLKEQIRERYFNSETKESKE